MIVILNYTKSSFESYTGILIKENSDYKITLKETEITKASHIILPDTDLLLNSIRKIQMMNLFSLLRMIKVPVLGVNNGLVLMCNKIHNIHKAGLGFYNIDVSPITNDKEFNELELSFKKDSKLLRGIQKESIKQGNGNLISANTYTTSSVKLKNNEVAVTMEEQNYFGIQLHLKENRKFFEKLLINFLSL